LPFELYDPNVGDGLCLRGMCKTLNTAPDENRFCKPIPPTELTDPTKSVEDTMRFTSLPANLNMGDVLSQGPGQGAFIMDFRKTLAAALDISVDMLEVTDISEGSLIVNFVIKQSSDPMQWGVSPTVVKKNLDIMRSSLDQRDDLGADSILGQVDTNYPPRSIQGATVAQAKTGAEQAMANFDGAALELIPPKTVVNPLIYSISTIGIADRAKEAEYLPENRAGITQDEKWESPEHVTMDVAMFIVPDMQEIDATRLCPSQMEPGDPVTMMWNKSSEGFGGIWHLETDSVLKEVKSWRIPPDRRMKVLSSECESVDWLESEQRHDKPDGFVPYKNNASCHGKISEKVWNETRCKSMTALFEKFPNMYRKTCNTELFPAKVLKFTTRTPLNAKWIMHQSREEGFEYAPLYQLDSSINYYFTWDPMADETESNFKKNEPPTGDHRLIYDEAKCAMKNMPNEPGKTYAPCVERVVYAGKMMYMGEHMGDNYRTIASGNPGLALHQMPATPPTLSPTISVDIDVERTIKVVTRSEPQNWPLEEDTLRQLLLCQRTTYFASHGTICKELKVDKAIFPFEIDLSAAMKHVSVANDGTVPLRPMEQYVFAITLGVFPTYKVDVWGSSQISQWSVEVRDLSVSKLTMPFNQRNQNKVRFKIQFDTSVQQRIMQPVMTVPIFIALLGGLMGFWEIGILCLGLYVSILKPFGLIGPLSADAVPEGQMEKFNQKIDKRRAKNGHILYKRLKEKHPGQKIDKEKLSRLILEQTDTCNLLKNTPIDDLLQKSGVDELTQGLPEHVTMLIQQQPSSADNHSESSEGSIVNKVRWALADGGGGDGAKEERRSQLHERIGIGVPAPGTLHNATNGHQHQAPQHTDDPETLRLRQRVAELERDEVAKLRARIAELEKAQ